MLECEAFMPDFAVLYSLRCRSLLVSHLVGWTQASHTDSSFLLGGARTPDRRGPLRGIAQREQSLILDSALFNSTRIREEQTANLRDT